MAPWETNTKVNQYSAFIFANSIIPFVTTLSVYFPQSLEYRVTDSIPKIWIELIQTLAFILFYQTAVSSHIKKENIPEQIHILQKISTLMYLCIPN